tara:strand:+ start:89 stop:271 length:183 start_codon:yes stop_codon:yes gene_type:complete
MKTFKQFREAYSGRERQDHAPKPPVDRKLRIDYGSGDWKKKYNMPTAPRGNFVPPKTVDV